jgi:predicted ArsR family transcriptional regulator
MASLCDLFHPPAEVITAHTSSSGFETQTNLEDIISMLQRRPCTAEEIARIFGMHLNEMYKYLGDLMQQGRVRTKRTSGFLYYIATTKERNRSYPHLNFRRENTSLDFDASRRFCKGQSKNILNKEALLNG